MLRVGKPLDRVLVAATEAEDEGETAAGAARAAPKRATEAKRVYIWGVLLLVLVFVFGFWFFYIFPRYDAEGIYGRDGIKEGIGNVTIY